jgi:mono/diheme cytochrome c family protein/glucose/arabinose dehydrogenase
MKILISALFVVFVACFLILMTGQSCSQKEKTKASSDSLTFSSSPVLSPQAAIEKMHIENGFEVKLVASEPLITAPVAMSFDKDGRIWVVQMNDYMPDTLGTGEEKPTGKVVILTDTNGDGLMDDRKLFLDSLVLPRAICLIEDGILIAEPPSLWYYQIKDDKPVNKTLVDAQYAEGGNVEHQPNGLLRAMDNWIYSAKSDKRYRKKGDNWLIEKTHSRGQWGISQDVWGRLFYNNNSENLLGDEFTPGLGAGNVNQRRVTGFDKKIVPDNSVYPARPTPGVNRGYAKDALDEKQRLKKFTAACGPVIYTGNLFYKIYYGNAFVAEPSANLIKRNILATNGYRIEGKQAYQSREFLASEDERFRPVNLYNGPDGALYIIDMYRGIIQHKTYLTPYLKSEITKRELTEPLNCGRIYKIVPKDTHAPPMYIRNDLTLLLRLLFHSNGWMRNEAQQILVDSKNIQLAASLRKIVQQRNNLLAVAHAMWTLEGLNVLEWNDLKPLLADTSWPLRMQGLSAVPSVVNKTNYREVVMALQSLVEKNDTLAVPYVAFLINNIQVFDKKAAHDMLITLSKKYGADMYVADAIISNLQNKEVSFYKEVIQINPDTALVLNKRLKKIMDDIASAKNASNEERIRRQFPRGARIFESVCQTCHGKDGNGIAGLAPPLNKSEFVANKNKLIPIVLYGLTGPVHVNGKLYKIPEISGDMPGIGQNPEYGNEDIAGILNFVRNSWNNKGESITPEEVNQVKIKYKGRANAFTVEELK